MDQKTIKNHYDFIVIGGGIVGAGILRDLALHNQDVLLLERGDFSSQTSQGSSKMLHGGIRYLENLDFSLVYEALREKKLWLKLAPNISKESRFYLPVYKNSKWPLFFLRIGLFIYDLLSRFKNPPYQILNRNELLKNLPGLKSDGLKGAGLYSDGIIDDSKLVFDLIFDSLARGASALNYHEIVSLDQKENTITISVMNHKTNEELQLTCRQLLFALGPFTDKVMRKLNIPWHDIILPSKGTHLWLKKDSLPITDGMVLQTKDKRIIFIIPERNAILVGTTEIPLNQSDTYFDIQPSQDEINYLIETVNEYFPQKNISESHVIASYCAVRPLVKSSHKQTSGKTSRHHKIYNPLENIYVVAGGKYTTFRVMAKDIIKKAFEKRNIKYNKELSLTPLTNTSHISDVLKQGVTLSDLETIIKTEMPYTMDDLVKRRLSLYALEQFHDPQKLNELLDKVKDQLPAFRNP